MQHEQQVVSQACARPSKQRARPALLGWVAQPYQESCRVLGGKPRRLAHHAYTLHMNPEPG